MRRAESKVGRQIAAAFSSYGKLGCVGPADFEEVQARFDSYAGGYRAQLDRLTTHHPPTAKKLSGVTWQR